MSICNYNGSVVWRHTANNLKWSVFSLPFLASGGFVFLLPELILVGCMTYYSSVCMAY